MPKSPLPPNAPDVPGDLDPLLERSAHAIVQRRLEAPALVFLELHRPLAFLGSQALIVITPLVGPAFGLENMERLTELFQDQRNLDRLLDRIEELAAERDAQTPTSAAGPAPENGAPSS